MVFEIKSESDEPLPKQVAKALQEFVAKYGAFPSLNPKYESIDVEIVDGKLVVTGFTVREQS